MKTNSSRSAFPILARARRTAALSAVLSIVVLVHLHEAAVAEPAFAPAGTSDTNLVRVDLLSSRTNGLQIVVHGPEGTPFGLQASDDFKSWTNIAVVNNGGANTAVTDEAAASFARRFYRCLSRTNATGIEKKAFGKVENRPVDLYTLRNEHGLEARICTYGGIVVSLKTPDRNGAFGDVVLGYDSLGGYLANSPYFGALIGRYANRIAKGQFTLNGRQYTLGINNAPNTLHGGFKGFDKRLWTGRTAGTGREPALELTYVSVDGEEGYPGTLTVKAVYSLTRDNALRLDFTAATDQDTVVNLSNHSYFNLAGSGTVLNHQVVINADQFTPVDSTLIPTGLLQAVANTPFDFTQPHTIGERLKLTDPQLKIGNGYDHNWVIRKPPGALDLVARVYEPASGRVLEVLSTEPGLQFYSGNYLDGSIRGKGGSVYGPRTAFCMEPQHYPDSPNKPQFPSVVLKPGETFSSTIIYRFSTQGQ